MHVTAVTMVRNNVACKNTAPEIMRDPSVYLSQCSCIRASIRQPDIPSIIEGWWGQPGAPGTSSITNNTTHTHLQDNPKYYFHLEYLLIKNDNHNLSMGQPVLSPVTR